MEMKKYLSGVVFLVLFSSVCAEGPVTAKDKVKGFYNENKTAVVATSAALVTGLVVLGGAFAYDKCNTIVGERDLKSFEKTGQDIAGLEARVKEINEVELLKEGADKDKLNKELKVLNKKVELFTAKLFIDAEIAKQDAKLVEAAATTDEAPAGE